MSIEDQERAESIEDDYHYRLAWRERAAIKAEQAAEEWDRVLGSTEELRALRDEETRASHAFMKQRHKEELDDIDSGGDLSALEFSDECLELRRIAWELNERCIAAVEHG